MNLRFFICLFAVACESYAGPFGLEMGTSLADLEKEIRLSQKSPSL
jgi:hypothetical protein